MVNCVLRLRVLTGGSILPISTGAMIPTQKCTAIRKSGRGGQPLHLLCLMLLMVALLLTSTAGAVEYTTYEEKVVTGEEVVEYVSEDDVAFLSAGNISPNYGVGSTNVAIFEGVVSKLPYGVHYVYWRDGQYNYRVAYSRDMVFTGSRFSAPQATIVTYYTYSGTGSQSTFTTTQDSNFSLQAGNYLVWSDLGDYPQLEAGKGVRDYVQTACVILVSFGLFSLFRGLWRSIRGRVD